MKRYSVYIMLISSIYCSTWSMENAWNKENGAVPPLDDVVLVRRFLPSLLAENVKRYFAKQPILPIYKNRNDFIKKKCALSKKVPRSARTESGRVLINFPVLEEIRKCEEKAQKEAEVELIKDLEHVINDFQDIVSDKMRVQEEQKRLVFLDEQKKLYTHANAKIFPRKLRQET